MRIFVAVELCNESILDSIENLQKKLQIKKAVKRENMHFTLQFLGEVKEDTIKNVKNALQEISFSSFELEVIGVGAFPRTKAPRVIWIGTDEKSGNLLKDVANKVKDALSPLGFKPDKPFKPHLTIFRIKNKPSDMTRELEKYRDHKFGKTLVSEIKLKQSKLTPTGSIYSDLEVVRSK